MSNGTQPSKASPPRAGEVRIKSISFVSKGLPMAGVNSVNDRVDAREDARPTGCDIFWNPAERHYRIVRFTEGTLTHELEMHESRVEFRVRWPV